MTKIFTKQLYDESSDMKQNNINAQQELVSKVLRNLIGSGIFKCIDFHYFD